MKRRNLKLIKRKYGFFKIQKGYEGLIAVGKKGHPYEGGFPLRAIVLIIIRLLHTLIVIQVNFVIS